jgi:hypothetical protein
MTRRPLHPALLVTKREVLEHLLSLRFLVATAMTAPSFRVDHRNGA